MPAFCKACSTLIPEAATECPSCKTPTEPIRTQLLESTRHLIPGYELLEVLGRGGMGTVYKARQIRLDRPVAVKILNPALGEDREYVARFLKEARLAARLNHPNIVQAVDCGEAEGRYYFVMEFIEGVSLEDELSRRGSLPEREALEIVGQVAEALAHAWERGIVHRDIKPSNIMVTHKRTAKLCDLGLCRNVSEGKSLTLTGMVHCTPAYASPEQAMGEKNLDTRSDVYSLGVTLYELVTGTLPFRAESPGEFFLKHVNERPVPPILRNRKLSPATSYLILQMMEKNKERRPAGGAEVSLRCRRILSALPDGSPPARPPVTRKAGPPRLPRPPKSSVPGKALAAAGAGIVAIAVALVLIPDGKPPPAGVREPAVPRAGPDRTPAPPPLAGNAATGPERHPPGGKKEAPWPVAEGSRKEAQERDGGNKAPKPEDALRHDPSPGDEKERKAQAVEARLQALIDQALAHSDRHEWKEAEKRLAEAERLPGSVRAVSSARERIREGMRRDRIEELIGSAQARLETDPEGAARDLEAARALSSEDPRIGKLERVLRFRSALGKARRLLETGDLPAAKEALARAMAENADDPAVRDLSRKIEDREKAEADRPLEEALAETRRAMDGKRWAEGRNALDRVLRDRPKDPRALELKKKLESAWFRDAMERANAHRQKGDWQAAMAAAREALSVRPGDPSARRLLDRLREASSRNPLLFQVTRTLTGHSDEVTALAMAANGTLVSGGKDRTVRVWDLAGGRQRFKMEGHSDAVRSVAISPDGKLAASGSDDKSILIWDLSKGKRIKSLFGHAGEIPGLGWSWDSRIVVSAARDGTIKWWDSTTGSEVHGVMGGTGRLAMRPDGRVFAAEEKDHSISLWDVDRREMIVSLQGHSDYVWALAFRSDGRVLAAASNDRSVLLWDVTDVGPRHKQVPPPKMLADIGSRLYALALSPDGSYLIAGPYRGPISVWDLAGGREAGALQEHGGSVWALVLSPDGRMLASGSSDRQIRIWAAKE